MTSSPNHEITGEEWGNEITRIEAHKSTMSYKGEAGLNQLEHDDLMMVS